MNVGISADSLSPISLKKLLKVSVIVFRMKVSMSFTAKHFENKVLLNFLKLGICLIEAKCLLHITSITFQIIFDLGWKTLKYHVLSI